MLLSMGKHLAYFKKAHTAFQLSASRLSGTNQKTMDDNMQNAGGENQMPQAAPMTEEEMMKKQAEEAAAAAPAPEAPSEEGAQA